MQWTVSWWHVDEALQALCIRNITKGKHQTVITPNVFTAKRSPTRNDAIATTFYSEDATTHPRVEEVGEVEESRKMIEPVTKVYHKCKEIGIDCGMVQK